MTEKPPASIEEVAAVARAKLTELRRMEDDLRNVIASARTRDGMVAVDVNADGRLRDLRLDPRCLDRMTPEELGAAVIRMVAEASAAAAERAGEIVAALVPEVSAPRPDLDALADRLADQVRMLSEE